MADDTTKPLCLGWREQDGKHLTTGGVGGLRFELAIHESRASLVAYARDMARGAVQDAEQILAEGREWADFADGVERGDIGPDPAAPDVQRAQA